MFIELACDMGITLTGVGALPNEHWQVVPWVTSIVMALYPVAGRVLMWAGIGFFGKPRREC